MFEFLNPFRYFRAKKRARLEAEKQIALRKERMEEALSEAKRRKDYADHLEELKLVVKQPRIRDPRVRDFLMREAGGCEQPTYSTADSVTNLLNSISEQSRVTAFEFGSTDTGSSDCSPSRDSGSASSDGGSSCGGTD